MRQGHPYRPTSIAKEGIQSCTHGLFKLVFLPSKARCNLIHPQIGC
uniref:CASTOR1 N-terminal domain-containing protein n=1 Tax=Oncorhynchus kisutch TaxID=8019 RepID=A0A8C7IDW4_ONCKI